MDKHFFQRLRLSVSSGISPRKAASWFDNNFSHIQNLHSATKLPTIEVVQLRQIGPVIALALDW
jgi:hypothetical protein